MTGENVVTADWAAHRRGKSVSAVIGIGKSGLTLGADTVLFQSPKAAGSNADPGSTSSEARLFALLAIAYRKSPDAVALARLVRISSLWEQGAHCRAAIQLAQMRLPQITCMDDAYRLYLGGLLLDSGMAATTLLRELDIEMEDWVLAKDYTTQPRVPAGSGPTSGEWISEGGGEGGSERTSDVSVTARLTAAVRQSLIAELDPAAETWLKRFAALLTEPTIFLAATFLIASTTSTRGKSTGTVPGEPGVDYEFNGDTGELSLTGADGTTVAAHRGADSRFYDLQLRVPVARLVTDSSGKQVIVLDDSVLKEWTQRDPDPSANPADDAKPAPLARGDNGKLCPDVSVDRGGPKRPFDAMFQEYVGSVENPEIQPPVPASLAYGFPRPNDPGLLMIDHCRESDGAFIEAKARYSHLLDQSWGRISIAEGLIAQLKNQIDAADFNGHRAIVYDVYDESMARFVRNVLNKIDKSRRVSVVHLGYPGDAQWPYPAETPWAKGLQKLC